MDKIKKFIPYIVDKKNTKIFKILLGLENYFYQVDFFIKKSHINGINSMNLRKIIDF